MATGYHDFTAGETLTAANLEDYCHLQGIMTFASAAARNAALAAVLREGLAAYLQDTNTLTVYSGAVWSTVAQAHGALQAWTPVWTQGATITKTINTAGVARQGRLVIAHFNMTATSAGTAANSILITLPVSSLNVGAIGSAVLFDASLSQFAVPAIAYATSTTHFGLMNSAITNATGAAVAPTIASGDIVSGTIIYEAAADA